MSLSQEEMRRARLARFDNSKANDVNLNTTQQNGNQNQGSNSVVEVSNEDEEEDELAAAIRLSLASSSSEDVPVQQQNVTSNNPSSNSVKDSTSTNSSSSTTTLALPSLPPTPLSHYSDGKVIRRVVAADNSCLFTSLSYLLYSHSRSLSSPLRHLISTTILSSPQSYPYTFLQRTPDSYASWILSPSSWGGAIELSIFANLFKLQIAAFDIQNLRMDCYGEDKGYKHRIYLLYDGIHYDPVALELGEGFGEEADVTIFGSEDEWVRLRVRKLAEEAKKKKGFTDVEKYGLRCLVCQEGVVGNDGAVQHAQSTGHTNFAENK